MIENRSTDILKFHAIGINYKKSNASTRGLFAVSNEQYPVILDLATGFGVSELFILSTCNRTEIYGFAENAGQLAALLCSQTKGDIHTFSQRAYFKQGRQAVQHLFDVGAGLDSQILGDYEIVGQIKTALRFSKERGMAGTFLERLVNGVLQASKAIKNETALSGGTISVSFAAVQCIRERTQDFADRKILLVGTGKIGRNTCKNLVDYLGSKHIKLINRTNEKALALAKELGVLYAPVENLAAEIASADIIIVSTNAPEPVILRSQLAGKTVKLVIDLSIPYNVEETAATLSNVQLVNIDELSKISDFTLAKRQAEIPKAKEIIAHHVGEFSEWLAMRRHAPMLKAIKSKLKEIHTSPLFSDYTTTINFAGDSPDAKIQKVINGTASKIRNRNQGGCYYIEAINEFIAIEAS